MVKRTRDQRKGFFISDEERKKADDTKNDLGLADHQLYNLGVAAARYGFGKPEQRGPADDPMIALHSSFKFDKGPRNQRCENCGCARARVRADSKFGAASRMTHNGA